jgi:hypothetical protein
MACNRVVVEEEVHAIVEEKMAGALEIGVNEEAPERTLKSHLLDRSEVQDTS